LKGEKRPLRCAALAYLPSQPAACSTTQRGSAALHSAITSIAGNCTDVYVTFDSDAADKPQIQLAERRLAGQLALLGPRPHIVPHPCKWS